MNPENPGLCRAQEALRLFPPGHISIREAVEDLDLDGHFVPKGTWMHVRGCSSSTADLTFYWTKPTLPCQVWSVTSQISEARIP